MCVCLCVFVKVVCGADCMGTLDLMTANWSKQRVLVVVVVFGSLLTLMNGSNDDNDICIVNHGDNSCSNMMVLFSLIG